MDWNSYKYNPTQAGAVVTFREGVTQEEAQAALDALRSLLDHRAEVKMFDPVVGSPVFYIP